MSRQDDPLENESSDQASFDLQAVLRQLESWQVDPPKAWQRRFRRFTARGVAWMLPGKPNSRSSNHPPVYVRDISRGGVGLLCSMPFDLDEYCQLELASEQVVATTLPAFCRHCLQVTDGVYLIGMEFGVNASVLLSLGVSAKALAEADDSSRKRSVAGDFVDPATLVEDDAA